MKVETKESRLEKLEKLRSNEGLMFGRGLTFEPAHELEKELAKLACVPWYKRTKEQKVRMMALAGVMNKGIDKARKKFLKVLDRALKKEGKAK